MRVWRETVMYRYDWPLDVQSNCMSDNYQQRFTDFTARPTAALALSWKSYSSVCLSHTCFLTKPSDAVRIFWHHTKGQLLWFSGTNSGWWATPLPSEICAQSDPPPSKTPRPPVPRFAWSATTVRTRHETPTVVSVFSHLYRSLDVYTLECTTPVDVRPHYTVNRPTSNTSACVCMCYIHHYNWYFYLIFRENGNLSFIAIVTV